MTLRLHLIGWLTMLGCLLPAHGQTPLDTLVQRAWQTAPTLKAYQSRIASQQARAQWTGSLPDPALQLQPLPMPVETRTGPQQLRIGAQQSFGWPGTYRTRRQAAQIATAALHAQQQQERRRIRTYIANHYYDGAYWNSYLAILHAQLSLLDMLDSLVQERFRQGLVSMVDVERVNIQRAALDFEIQQATLQLRQITAILRRWTNLSEIAFPRIDSLPLPTLPALSNAEQHLRDSSWTFQTDSLRWQQAEVNARLARLTTRPAFTIGANYIVIGGGKDALVAPSLGLRTPIFQKKNKAHIRAAQAEATGQYWRSRHTLRQQADALDRLAAQFQTTQAAYQSHRQQTQAAQHSFRILVTDYGAGNARFWEVINMLNQIFMHQKLAIQQQRTLYKTKLAIEEIIGTLN